MDPRLYNSRIIDTFLKFIKARYPQVDVNDILRYAGMEPYEVADQAFWFTQEQVNRFYQRTVKLTGNENVAREAGRYAATPGTLGAMRQYTLGLLGPTKTFNLIQKITRNFTRSADYTSNQIDGNAVELVVTPFPGVKEEEFQCKNRIGFFEAVVTIFNLSTPKIEHPECLFKGGSCCRYVIRWHPTASTWLKKIRDIYLAVAVIGNGIVFFKAPQLASTFTLPVSILLFMLLYLLIESSLRKELMKGLDHLWDSSEKLAEQIDVNYRNTQLTREIGEVISNKTSINEVIDSVTRVLENILDYDRGLVLLADSKEERLEIRGAFGYSKEHLRLLGRTSFRLNQPHGRGPFVIAFHQKKPILINNVSEIENNLTPKSLEFVRTLGTQSFLCCPIILKGKAIGILAVDNLRTKRPFVNSDVNLLLGIAPAIGISIQNAQLLEAQAATFENTLSILADSIDARDFLTAGHSQVVTEYAGGIARELGMSEEYCQMIRTAALLHDYGKIGVPDSILKKDGPLTDSERAIINTHPAKTREILEKVPFQGMNAEIPAVTGSHHERWDGTGYPNALKGEEIPLGARILAVADFYEAITAKRHYREPMSTEEALQTLQGESGSHFEPRIVDAFVRYLKNNSFCPLDTSNSDEQHPPTEEQPPRTRQPRIDYRTQVSTKVDRRIISGASVDISLGGLFINTEATIDIQPGIEVSISFTPPWDTRPVQVPGMVAWVNSGNPLPAPRLPKGFAVRFNHINGELHHALREYVEFGMRQPSPLFAAH